MAREVTSTKILDNAGSNRLFIVKVIAFLLVGNNNLIQLFLKVHPDHFSQVR